MDTSKYSSELHRAFFFQRLEKERSDIKLGENPEKPEENSLFLLQTLFPQFSQGIIYA